MARPFLSRDGPLLRPMSVRYYGAPEADGPDGDRSHPAKDGGGLGGRCHPARYCARCVRAPKSVIDLKSMQKYPEFRPVETLGQSDPGPGTTGAVCFSRSGCAAGALHQGIRPLGIVNNANFPFAVQGLTGYRADPIRRCAVRH
jgi:hypothetical protein